MTVSVDSNVLIYSAGFMPADAAKKAISRDLLDNRDCVLSVQALNEFLYQITRQNRPDRIDDADALAMIAVWRRFPVIPLDMPLFDIAVGVRGKTRYAWWDCLIVAAAITAGSDTLMTDDMQHGRVIDGVRIENPFRDVR